MLAGRSSAITIQGGSAVLDLYPFIEAAKQDLVAAVALAALVVVFLDRPTGGDILLVAIGLVVLLGVIEFLNQPREPQAEVPPPRAEGDHTLAGSG